MTFFLFNVLSYSLKARWTKIHGIQRKIIFLSQERKNITKPCSRADFPPGAKTRSNMKILRNEKIVRISKSESFSCLKEFFCPGTIWLLKEHKLCVEELQKLKSMIEDLHRCFFLVHSTNFTGAVS